MGDARVSFLVDEDLLVNADAQAAKGGWTRSEYLRNLILADLKELQPSGTEKLVHARSTDWLDRKTRADGVVVPSTVDADGLAGVPRYFVYRANGSFHTETAGSVDGLTESVEAYRRQFNPSGNAAFWETYWRSKACQPVYVGESPWGVTYWGDDPPALHRPERVGYLIQYVNPHSKFPSNRHNITVDAMDPSQDTVSFDLMIETLKRSAHAWRERD